MKHGRLLLGGAALLAAILIARISTTEASGPLKWQTELQNELHRIDSEFEGEVGVYVKRLRDGREVNYQSSQPWYLASTIKVFVGAALLHEVEAGRLKLTDKVILRRSDFVDGSGEVIWKKPGQVMSLGYLFEKMLTQSDSTATDILIRKIGEDRLNQFIQDQTAGIARITTILAVRHDAYSEIHPAAKRLTNLDFIAFKKVSASQRGKALARKLRVGRKSLKTNSVSEAFERYYARGLNSGRLDSFGRFIERLLDGQILSAEHTRLMLGTMTAAVTGKARIQSGLPKNFKFAQKTGTQINRMCNVGKVIPPDSKDALIVTVCMRDFSSSKSGEKVFKAIGKALHKIALAKES